MKKRFTNNKNGTVTDNKTGLMWLKNPRDYNKGHVRNWKDAVAGCKKFKFAGYKDWRLPTVHELFSIVDFTKTKFPLADKIFTFGDRHWFWSATKYVPGNTNAVIVGFNGGNVANFDKTSACFVRPVRGGKK